jgi:hypothetical protein
MANDDPWEDDDDDQGEDEDEQGDDTWEDDDDTWDGQEVFDDYDSWLEHYLDGYFDDAEYEEADGGVDYSGE